MKRIYLIRHGLPDFPGGRRMCIGSTDIPLGGTGVMQARQMAAKLPELTAVFSSPLSRAVQTAQAIGMHITILEGLRELDAGEWDGLTFEQIRARYPELYAARSSDRTLPLPGGEPDEAGLARFTGAMEAAAERADGAFAVVAHGGVLALFLESIGAGRYKPGYCEIVPIIWNNGIFTTEEAV